MNTATLNYTMSCPPIQQVKPGALITFVDGPGGSPHPHVATHSQTGHAVRVLPNYQFGDSLLVRMDNGTFRTIHAFTRVGVGAYCWTES